MIEKHASSQSSALQDLQNELRSLKTLLQARQLAPPPSSQHNSPNPSSSTSAPTNNNGASGNGTPTNGGVSATTEAANSLLNGRGKGRGIPAWQMQMDGGGSGGSGGSGSEGGSLAGSGVLEKEGEGSA